MESQIASAMTTVEEHSTTTNAKLDEIAEKMRGLADWMETMNKTTADLTKSTSLLQLHAEDTASRLGLLESGHTARRPGDAATAPTTPVTNDVHVRRDADVTRGQDLGVNRPPDPPPAHGTSRSASLVFDTESDPEGLRYHSHRPFTSTPKMDFPKFDGDDYQIWIDNCNLYFEIY